MVRIDRRELQNRGRVSRVALCPGRSKSLPVPQVFVVEIDLMPLRKRQVLLWNSSGFR